MLMREFITAYFKKEQWEVFEAKNGRLGLEIFEQISVDLVVLDIMMPELDGRYASVFARSRKYRLL